MPALPRVTPSDRQLGRLLNALAGGETGTYRVVDLPTVAVANGSRAFATDGLKVGETTGLGTGCPVYFDQISGLWKRYSDDTTVAA